MSRTKVSKPEKSEGVRLYYFGEAWARPLLGHPARRDQPQAPRGSPPQGPKGIDGVSPTSSSHMPNVDTPPQDP